MVNIILTDGKTLVWQKKRIRQTSKKGDLSLFFL